MIKLVYCLKKFMLITHELGGQMYHFWVQLRLGHLAVREGNLTEAGNIFTESVQTFQKDGIGDKIVFTLEGVASLFVALGNLPWLRACQVSLCP